MAIIKILTIMLIEPLKQKPDSRYYKQTCGDWQCCMEMGQHFKMFSNSFLEKFAKILIILACSMSLLGGFLPDRRYIVIK